MSKQLIDVRLRSVACAFLIMVLSAFTVIARVSAEPAAIVAQNASDQFITPLPSRVIPGRVSAGGEPAGAIAPPAVPTHVTAAVPHTTSTSPHKGYAAPGFLVTTTSSLQNFQVVQYMGLVEGAAVRQPTWNQDASAGMQEAVGGSLDSYAQMQEEARTQAFTTLIARAKEMGANGVLGVHFDSQSFPLDKGHFATGVTCVGTAVVVRSTK